jgi:hypothetical protein
VEVDKSEASFAGEVHADNATSIERAHFANINSFINVTNYILLTEFRIQLSFQPFDRLKLLSQRLLNITAKVSLS